MPLNNLLFLFLIALLPSKIYFCYPLLPSSENLGNARFWLKTLSNETLLPCYPCYHHFFAYIEIREKIFFSKPICKSLISVGNVGNWVTDSIEYRLLILGLTELFCIFRFFARLLFIPF